jgi:hypothetical protein
MEQLFNQILQQTPLVITLILGIYYFTKQIEKKEKEFAKEREFYRAEIRNLNNTVLDESQKNSNVFLELSKTIEKFTDKNG